MRSLQDQRKLARKRLDARLAQIQDSLLTSPPQGWIRAIRQALGMTSSQLGRRMGISQAAVVQLEKAEAEGTIGVSTLRRVAAALNCKLVYALVPNEPLETMVQARAINRASQLFRSVERTMALENQTVEGNEVKKDQLGAVIDHIDMRELWNDD